MTSKVNHALQPTAPRRRGAGACTCPTASGSCTRDADCEKRAMAAALIDARRADVRTSASARKLVLMQLVIFDLDGTLTETTSIDTECYVCAQNMPRFPRPPPPASAPSRSPLCANSEVFRESWLRLFGVSE